MTRQAMRWAFPWLSGDDARHANLVLWVGGLLVGFGPPPWAVLGMCVLLVAAFALMLARHEAELEHASGRRQ